MNLPTFLDCFCFRLATAENESNIVYSEQDEKDSDDGDGLQIKFDKVVNTNTTNGELLFSLSVSKYAKVVPMLCK